MGALAGSQPLKIHFIDVGEGDSIEAPSGKTVLIDAGNLISGYRVFKYLEKRNILNLDNTIFTHSHFDHIGGV
ncbi:MAG: MBL fold metallo-hydrolase [Candidatus Omnitrophica bacterium]|nr:MBL fold metallo-hydrolase [Candidatus Omnitrophota bacterium]